ncbi:hypothetical protein PHLCEN_2v2724 [Hermanssonia centrifuga]|uniref:Uncharacterized protein n=1 Tax=Hermanssonia centrifuga TaxID=98765 RepID=A0A2R6RHR8_9APHY|nr:hypothetical protein PHLCEN_2v2724 [Hermanssonia centrifuga]
MLAAQQNDTTLDMDPFVSYAQSLHDYTLQLWTESIRVAEEKGRLVRATMKVGGPINEEGRKHKEAGGGIAGVML